MARKMVSALIDRPIGYKDKHGNCYPVNYGYIPRLLAGDGKEQDVYVLSEKAAAPLTEFQGEVAAIIHRRDDVEDKWVLVSEGETIDRKTIKKKTYFLEQYFDSWIELLEEEEL